MFDAPPILDIRSEPEFFAAHASGSGNISLEELPQRTYELPDKGATIWLYDSDPERLCQASNILEQRGYGVCRVNLTTDDLTETGPSKVRLWRPNAFLVEALGHPALKSLPGGAKALDLACGAGRDAVYLALQGYAVDAIDVLPDALAKAHDLAQRNGVTIRTIHQDLKRQPTLPGKAYDLVTVCRFLHRPLFPAIRNCVKPGGFVVYETFHVRDRAGQEPTQAARHALQDGELAVAFAGFTLHINRNARQRRGRWFSQVLGQRL